MTQDWSEHMLAAKAELRAAEEDLNLRRLDHGGNHIRAAIKALHEALATLKLASYVRVDRIDEWKSGRA